MQQITLKSGKKVCLGRIRPKARPQALRFGAYYDKTKDRVPPPTSLDYFSKAMPALERMYLNDTYGDCVIAGKYHQVGVWSGNDGPVPIQGTDQEVLTHYHKICGPGDNGCVITDVLDYFRDRGLIVNGKAHKIDGYVSVDNTNKLEVQVALLLFGSLTLGIDLPNDWTCTDCVWDVTSSRIVGGHDICAVGYDVQGVRCATWGGLVTITWAAFTSRKWITELYAQLAPDWYNDDQLAPNGVNVATLKADLAKLGGGEIPPLPDEPPDPSCPPGQHWDSEKQACVDDPPTPPQPMTCTIVIPQQEVVFDGRRKAHLPSITVTGTCDMPLPGGAVKITLPPWLLALITLVCSGMIPVPPQLKAILAILCGLIPHNAKEIADAGSTCDLTLPSNLVEAINQAAQSRVPLIGATGFVVGQLYELAAGRPPCNCP